MTATLHTTPLDTNDIWSRLAAPLPAGVISWRQDGRPVQRGDKFVARWVAYVEANTVRERLDSVVPGEWDFTVELLPPVAGLDDDANQGACNFKARLQVLGVIREDVGTGKDYKQACTDAFKRVAVRFGIGHELYSYEQNWVQMDGDGKYAKPIEDPAVAYARRYGKPKLSGTSEGAGNASQRSAADSGRGKRTESTGNSAPASQADHAGETPESARMPFGKHKGKPLGEIDEADLVSTIQWATKTDKAKFADLITNCQLVIDRRAGAQADAFSDEPPF